MAKEGRSPVGFINFDFKRIEAVLSQRSEPVKLNNDVLLMHVEV